MFPVTRHPQNPLTGIIAEIPTEPLASSTLLAVAQPEYDRPFNTSAEKTTATAPVIPRRAVLP